MIDLSHMTTETRNRNTMELSKMTSLEIITEMNREDAFPRRFMKYCLLLQK